MARQQNYIPRIREKQGDKIVYLLISNGGGIDGMDRNDKGGDIVAASFDFDDIDKHANKPWGHLVKRVVNIEDARKDALKKLTPVDKLVLDLYA